MYNKTITRFGFCDIQNNRGLGYQPQPTASADNPYLDYSGYHKNLIQYLFNNTIQLTLLLGPVHTNPFSNENGAVLLQGRVVRKPVNVNPGLNVN